jgi:hypothetical protein
MTQPRNRYQIIDNITDVQLILPVRRKSLPVLVFGLWLILYTAISVWLYVDGRWRPDFGKSSLYFINRI